MTTVREEVKKLLAEIRKIDDMQGEPASEYAYKLAAWLGNIGEEIWRREVDIARMKVTIMREHSDLPMTKIEAMVRGTDEYAALLEAKYLREAADETIKTLKYRMRNLAEEYNAVKRTS